MRFRAVRWARFVSTLALVLLPASAAHAQRIPDAALWWAGTGVLAPFLAIPVKLGIVRLLGLEASASRLWMIGAIEWMVWFPLGFFLLRYARSSPPVVVLLLFACMVWLHRTRVVGASWSSGLYLSLPTPILAVTLPVLAFAVHQFVERHPA